MSHPSKAERESIEAIFRQLEASMARVSKSQRADRRTAVVPVEVDKRSGTDRRRRKG